jgi:hypothetical protein
MQSWKMLLFAPIGAMLLGFAAPAEAGDRGRDRSDRRIEQRFTDGRDWRHSRDHSRHNDWRHNDWRHNDWRRDDRWDRRGDWRNWRKDEWRGRQHARDRRAWERKADNLERGAELLRERGQFREAERFERQARRIDRRLDKRDRRGDRWRHGGGFGPFIRWHSF